MQYTLQAGGRVLTAFFQSRLCESWKATFRLAWPVTVEQLLRTLMRTTDMIVAGVFSPAAVAAVGLADIYSRVTTRVGLAVGGATIALASQDTGSGADANRNEAVTQAFILGILTGIPFIILAFFFSSFAISVLGAEREVVRLGAQYLLIIMISAPAIHLSKIGAQAIQGTGDTRTPMVVRSITNILNIVGTVVLAFGLGPFPALSIIGIGVATAIGETVTALIFGALIFSPLNELQFTWPSDLTIAWQLITISIPRFAEGMAEMVVEFPFNAILLVFGTEVNAAYHIGRRLYSQVVEPLARAYGITANVLVGQALGEGNPDRAYFEGIGTVSLGVITIGGLALVLFVGAELFVQLFTRDPTTIGYAVHFAQAYAVAAVFIAGYKTLSGGLRGGSDTRSPFIGTVIGTFTFMFGVSYIGGIVFEVGVVAAYIGIILDFAWRALFLGGVYYRRRWIAHGTALMEDRGSLDAETKANEQ